MHVAVPITVVTCNNNVQIISQQEPAFPNTIPNQVQPPPPLIMADDKPEFKISDILDTKIDNCCHTCKLLYLVCWTGYEGTNKETSWILASELGHVSKLVADFHKAYLAKTSPLSSLS